jgi:hypothetical protein
MIKTWVALGASVVEMALYLNLRPGQIKKYYAHELAVGEFENNMAVGKTILDLAKLGVPDMAKFWAKSRMGWRDTDKADGGNTMGMFNLHIHTGEEK